MSSERSCDVLIVGAGPAGLTLANLLGGFGLSTLLIEANADLIDYPRGVSMDDESLRVFQSIGLVDAIREHTTSDQWIRYITAGGRMFASVEPRTREFGWPRRNAFIQPAVDRVLLDGLSRFENVSVLFSHSLKQFEQDDEGIVAAVEKAGDGPLTVHAKFIVGCDGGRSTVRKALDIPFEGKTDSTRWLVVDIQNDPLSIPDAYLFCDPARPRVSMSLPHGVRRFEFMVFENESDAEVTSQQGLNKLLAMVLPNQSSAEIIRARVYTHHARLAERFVSGRALLAGDAAHLMPVWQGQGFNSGIRDASNIAWKLAAVMRRLCRSDLLATYDSERREHAAAMISLSVLVGRIFSPTNVWLARLRDVTTYVLGAIPAVKNYILQMRFKPMPFYSKGVVVHRNADRKLRAASPVGRMVAQPFVTKLDGQIVRFDDAVGNWFVVTAWGVDPRHFMDSATLEFWRAAGARFVSIVLDTQAAEARRREDPELTVLVDTTLAFKDWFGRHQCSFVVIRPDRFVAAAGTASEISATTRIFRSVMYATE